MTIHTVLNCSESQSITSWHNGYQQYSLSEENCTADLDRSISDLSSYFPNLPLDPYDAKKTRYRWYGRGLYLPWTKTFQWVPETVGSDGKSFSAYYQANHNPEHHEEFRYFETISPKARENAALLLCIRKALGQTEWDDADNSYPVSVGVHFISQRVDPENPVAVVSPNCMHQDGETYDYVFLVNRHGVEGGVNYIAPTSASGKQPDDLLPEEIIERFTLTAPLQGFGVKDIMVSHGVSEVKLSEGSNSGYRNTLLIDTVTMRENYR